MDVKSGGNSKPAAQNILHLVLLLLHARSDGWASKQAEEKGKCKAEWEKSIMWFLDRGPESIGLKAYSLPPLDVSCDIWRGKWVCF